MKLLDRARELSRRCKREITALYYACKSPAMPWLPRMLALAAIAYALSPIDLIPDFIPVLGYLDDLFILPALIWLAVRLIPPDIMQQARRLANAQPITLPKNLLSAAMIIIAWTSVALLVAWLAFG